MLDEVSESKEDIGMAATAGEDSNDGVGNDSVKWLLPKRLSVSTSIWLFVKGVASPFGFLIEGSNEKKGNYFPFQRLKRSVKRKANLPGLDEIGQIMN